MADDGFFSRWSRRKVQVRQGDRPPEEPPAPLTAPAAAPAAPGAPAQAVASGPVAEPAAGPDAPAPTLQDVAQLGRDSDFSRFVASDVDPGVKNAALRKLFSDPHFNVMDGLDIYIDDYSKPDPIPPAMLRQLTQSKLLGLFDDEEEADAAAAGTPDRAPAGEHAAADVAAAEAGAPAALPDAAPSDDAAAVPPLTAAPDEDADLQLQPHDAAGRRGPGPGAAAG